MKLFFTLMCRHNLWSLPVVYLWARSSICLLVNVNNGICSIHNRSFELLFVFVDCQEPWLDCCCVYLAASSFWLANIRPMRKFSMIEDFFLLIIYKNDILTSLLNIMSLNYLCVHLLRILKIFILYGRWCVWIVFLYTVNLFCVFYDRHKYCVWRRKM